MSDGRENSGASYGHVNLVYLAAGDSHRIDMLTDTDILARRFQWTSGLKLQMAVLKYTCRDFLRQHNADDETDVEGLIAQNIEAIRITLY